MRVFEVEGDSVEEIISHFMKEKDVPSDFIKYEVVEQGSKGLFGLGKKTAKVKINYNEVEHVKKKGKKAVHLGGALQLLFGIRGKRWENPNYGVKEWGIPYGSYSTLINPYWASPGELGKPKNANQVEGACYW